MRVTEVKIFPVKDPKLRAFVSVVFDHCFMVNDIKVIEGREGRFISMPSRRKRNGRFKDIAHPLNSDTRAMLESEILAAYEASIGDGRSSVSREPTREEAREEVVADGGTGAVAEPAGDAAPDREPSSDTEPRTLEEVTEKHLSDSFWTS